MAGTELTEDEARQVFVDQIHALADQARAQGPAPDCEGRMAAIGARHRAAIDQLRRRQAQSDEDRPTVRPGL